MARKRLKSLLAADSMLTVPGLAASLCFLTLICMASLKAKAAEFTENGYVYSLMEAAGGETYAAITAYMGEETELVVPESLGGRPVREVRLNSLNTEDFMRYERIRSVVFPDTMVSLNFGACMYFGTLTSVVIPEGTEEIGANAFAGCQNLESIAIPSSVTSIYGSISNNETLTYRVQSGSYADEFLTNAGKNVTRTGVKTPVTDLRIEGEKECVKTLEFVSPSQSRTICLEAEIFPANASNRRIEWEADGADVILLEDESGQNHNSSKIYAAVKKGGTAAITATSKDGGYTAVCTINAAVSLACQEIMLSQDTFVYDGKEKRPKVIINGLAEGEDYTVSYGSNIAAGTGIVTISGIGANTGRVTKSFTIMPSRQETAPGSNSGATQNVSLKKPAGFQVKNIKKNKAKLTWKTVKGADGYEIYRSAKKNGRYKKVKAIRKNSITSFTNSKLKKRSQYFYKIRSYRIVGGVKSFSSFTRVKKVTIKK